ncbi:hypothetical protein THAR02_08481 [Trichoderma harzianum]|uniref:Uncharacterized protein n=1 Tax=Trichoderma harzianum TaxID=5544 RepID=A0A0F9X2F1_TRIHA|nr:hypothetical protein THAR02_08481 [Trichoderma harzianum]
MSSQPRQKPDLVSDVTSQTAANETKPKMFDKEGAIGQHFTEDGAIGGMGQKVGGPFAKDGMIGEHFTAEGKVGGTVQSMMGGKKDA